MPQFRRPSRPLAALALLVMFGASLITAPAEAQGGSQSAAPVLVEITSATVAGTYTVSWQTLGGCDPGEGTSGRSGEVVLTVEAEGSPDDTPTPGKLTGTEVNNVVVIHPFCIYRWTVSLVEATTEANCIVGPSPFAPDANNEIRITLADPAASCSQGSGITVRIHPITPVATDDSDHNAILKTQFTATARPVKNAPKRCSTRTAVSEVDDKKTPGDTTDDTVSIELKVVDTTAAGRECRYDVSLGLPRQLTAAHGQDDPIVFKNVDPLATLDFSVGVARKTIYLLQSVIGDSGEAYARYKMSKTCGDPDPLPEVLLPHPATGGIRSTPTATLVELREGRFNITAALADDPSADDAFDGIASRVLDNEGDECEATVSVSHLPERCVAEEEKLTLDLTATPRNTIFEFEITCGDDVATATGETGTTGDGSTGETGTTGDGSTGETGTTGDGSSGDTPSGSGANNSAGVTHDDSADERESPNETPRKDVPTG